jgi:succinate dehydrogenase/fumarate reductase flavoprotein subunit
MQRNPELNPPCSYKDPRAVDKAPFYAFPYEAGMTATFGGPKINASAQVVDLEDKPITGLYAAGNAAGGLFFKDYVGGSQLGGATVFGRIAAAKLPKRARRPPPVPGASSLTGRRQSKESPHNLADSRPGRVDPGKVAWSLCNRQL